MAGANLVQKTTSFPKKLIWLDHLSANMYQTVSHHHQELIYEVPLMFHYGWLPGSGASWHCPELSEFFRQIIASCLLLIVY